MPMYVNEMPGRGSSLEYLNGGWNQFHLSLELLDSNDTRSGGDQAGG